LLAKSCGSKCRHGAPALTLYDPNGKNRAELALTRDGAPALTILDRDGFLAWKTPN